MATRSYRVVIPYTQSEIDETKKTHEKKFTVRAPSARQAKEIAVERFRRSADDLPVQWTREIIPGDIRVEFTGRTMDEVREGDRLNGSAEGP